VYAGSYSDLRVGMTRYALLLDEAGIVRDDGVIARLAPEHYYLTTTTGGAVNVYRELLLWNTRWRMNVSFVNSTGHRGALNLAGPARREVLQPLVDVDLSEAAFPYLAIRQVRLDGMPVRMLRAGFVASLGFEIHARFADVARVWRTLLADQKVQAFGVEAQRVLRLEKGHAIVAQDTDNLTNPFEAGLGFAVRMGKPFFIGQRSLRIHQQRGARQKLVGFELDSPEAPIRESHLLIHDGDIAGRVTSIARSPTLGRTIGFAMSRPDLVAPGAALSIRASDGTMVPARIVRTPFVEVA
jgi:sarcosine oxidase, subunit alpha